ncbi:probable 3-hydroxyisobutyrate dehydrogenase-like 3, mitochondrial [Hordeum vulgare subsp. vulgare]|uniref:probable 3-hydroxyisobutyrate dehydrogenase-like 3, mitochondrial n=1 Tax=Hordeum vulgare subsp. vulgare TaxID=112509 RepID=UPI001D1A53FE|nr:probable 3-hydroxyisobutyrate dehydrogenase-like 3, mitochondrial [Hordeum vulgare subsp. vulgare]
MRNFAVLSPLAGAAAAPLQRLRSVMLQIMSCHAPDHDPHVRPFFHLPSPSLHRTGYVRQAGAAAVLIADTVDEQLLTMDTPGGVLVDCTSSSPALAHEIAAAARAAGCHAVDCPVSGGDIGARDGTLALLAGGDEAVVAWPSLLFAHLDRPTYMGPAGSGQSSKIANQITVAGAVVGLGESLAFAGAAGLDERLFLGAVSKGAVRSRVMDIFGERALSRDFASGGAVHPGSPPLGPETGQPSCAGGRHGAGGRRRQGGGGQHAAGVAAIGSASVSLKVNTHS